MSFYHERYHETYQDACYAQAAFELPRSCDRGDDGRTYEPIRIPPIVSQLVIMSVVLCAIFIAVQALS